MPTDKLKIRMESDFNLAQIVVDYQFLIPCLLVAHITFTAVE